MTTKRSLNKVNKKQGFSANHRLVASWNYGLGEFGKLDFPQCGVSRRKVWKKIGEKYDVRCRIERLNKNVEFTFRVVPEKLCFADCRRGVVFCKPGLDTRPQSLCTSIWPDASCAASSLYASAPPRAIGCSLLRLTDSCLRATTPPCIQPLPYPIALRLD